MARPELDRLRDDSTKSMFDAVLVNDVDRVARDVAHLGIIKRDFERKKVNLIFRKLPGEQSPTHNLMVNILGSFAEFEKELINDRMRRGKRHKVEVRKQFVGCNAPYGYRYVGKQAANQANAGLAVIPEEVTVVRQMLNWASRGWSLRKIASQLNELRIPTRKISKGWKPATVHRIVRSEIYVGIWSYGKRESIEPRWPKNKERYRRHLKSSGRRRPRSEWIRIQLPDQLKVVDLSLWSKAQEKMNENPRFSPRNSTVDYLLRGLVRCGYCGHGVGGRFSKWKNQTYAYYHCWMACKESRWVRREALESAVWKSLTEALLNPSQLRQRIKVAQSQVASNTSQSPLPTSTVGGGLEETRLFQRYREGEISAQQLAKELEECRDRASWRPQQNGTAQGVPSIRSFEETCRAVAAELRTATPELKHEIIRRLVTKAVLKVSSIRIFARIELPDDDRNSADGSASKFYGNELLPLNYSESENRELVTPLSDRANELSPSRDAIRNCTMTEFDLIAMLPPPLSNSSQRIKQRYALEVH